MRIITFNCPGNFNINQFGDFDLFFVQRMPRSMVLRLLGEKSYIGNYPTGGGVGGGRGICIVSKERQLAHNVVFGTFSWYKKHAGDTQGKHWQTFTTNMNTSTGLVPIRFINALPSYPEEDGSITDEHRILQTSELLDLVDYRSVLVGDFHMRDDELEDEISLQKRSLTNHIPADAGTFLGENDHSDSIDKIITTKISPIRISNVSVIKYDRNEPTGHWPIAFDLEV
jgi:hypothetical protein